MKALLPLIIAVMYAALPIDSASAAPTLKNFETDYCTLFLDGPTNNPGQWKHCCLEHDLRYWFGGSEADMDMADLRLRTCVTKAAGDTWADLIYFGVRAGHHSPIKNKYQWSWGWTEKRKNQTLSLEESLYIERELKKLNITEVSIADFIRDNLVLSK